MDRATIRVALADRTVDVFLQLPHRVEISDPSGAGEVRGVLEALGIFDPGLLPDDARSLAALAHPDWRCRGIIRDAAFEALVKKNRFVRVAVAHVATEDARMHGSSYVVRPVPGDRDAEYALAEDRAYGARLVTADDRVAWRLDQEALADAMRADLGATCVDGASAVAIDGVLDLGVVSSRAASCASCMRGAKHVGRPPRRGTGSG